VVLKRRERRAAVVGVSDGVVVIEGMEDMFCEIFLCRMLCRGATKAVELEGYT
jgi:hypothetical protein